MPAVRNFKVCQTSLGVRVSHGFIVDNEIVMGNRALETLLPTPSHTVREMNIPLWKGYKVGLLLDHHSHPEDEGWDLLRVGEIISDYSPFTNQDEITKAMYDNSSFALLNNIGKDIERGRRTGISLGENIDLGAYSPIHVHWGMNGLLDIFSIEINNRFRSWCFATRNGQVSLSVPRAMETKTWWQPTKLDHIWNMDCK